jgi:methionyl-tRNA formyltransferase
MFEMTIGLLISGNLGHKALCLLNESSEKVSFVMTDKGSESIIVNCNKFQIPVFVGNPRNNKASSFISNKKCDILLSINYLFLIEKDIIQLPKKYAINIHGSLLPKYRGRTPHVWSIINNEKIAGVTAHLITEACDAGDIIYQKKIHIRKTYTGNDIILKYGEIYPLIIFKILEFVRKNEIKFQKQNEKLASYFPKRIPEDGIINWDWQKERIYNWVRALSFPYPGAFTFYKGEKIIINKIKYSNLGFSNEIPNGTIVKYSNKTLFVKVQNGVIQVLEYFSNANNIFQINAKFE